MDLISHYSLTLGLHKKRSKYIVKRLENAYE
jgi:hypothetical protein